jgi:hypothetical protein
MKKLIVTGILIFNNIVFPIRCFGQSPVDSIHVPLYKLHLNHKPQDGYGLILGFLGNSISDKNNKVIATRNVFKIGIAKTKHSYAEDGIMYSSKSVAIEINQIDNQTIYGFVVGTDIKAMLFDFGLYANYRTDFSLNRSFSLRPRFAISLFYWTNLDLTVEYDIPLVQPNFENVSNWSFGLQYTIGVIRKNTSE